MFSSGTVGSNPKKVQVIGHENNDEKHCVAGTRAQSRGWSPPIGAPLMYITVSYKLRM